MERLLCPKRCREVTERHPQYCTFDVEEWFLEDRNYALIEGENIAFGEWKKPGLYWVHFCFDEAKGREAINLCRKMFFEFCRVRPVWIAIGLIALDNRKARWLIRQVGFHSLGETETENGPCEMFYSVRNFNGSE